MTDSVASQCAEGPTAGVDPPPPLPQLQVDEANALTDVESTSLGPVPVQTVFTTREELLLYVTDFSLSQGFAVVTHKSNVPRGQLWLRCDMGGSARPVVPPLEAKRKRKNSSRMQNCPYQLYGRRLQNGTWALKVQNAQHTHDCARDPQELEHHPKARRLTNAQKRLVIEMTDLGVRPSIIVDRLKERFPDKPIKVRDIYNARNYIRTERRAGRVPYPECREDGEEEAANAVPGERPAERGVPVHVDHQIQELWATMAGVMATWTTEKKQVFRDDLQCLVDKFTVGGSESSVAGQELNSIDVGEEDAAPLDVSSLESVIESSAGNLPAQHIPATLDQ